MQWKESSKENTESLCFLEAPMEIWYNRFYKQIKGMYRYGKNRGVIQQQLKSKETKDRIFQAAKTILRKKGYEGLSIKIYVKKQAFPMEASIII